MKPHWTKLEADLVPVIAHPCERKLLQALHDVHQQRLALAHTICPEPVAQGWLLEGRGILVEGPPSVVSAYSRLALLNQLHGWLCELRDPGCACSDPGCQWTAAVRAQTLLRDLARAEAQL